MAIMILIVVLVVVVGAIGSLVSGYTTRIETVPAVVVARAAGYGEREHFQAEGDARGPGSVTS